MRSFLDVSKCGTCGEDAFTGYDYCLKHLKEHAKAIGFKGFEPHAGNFLESRLFSVLCSINLGNLVEAKREVIDLLDGTYKGHFVDNRNLRYLEMFHGHKPT